MAMYRALIIGMCMLLNSGHVLAEPQSRGKIHRFVGQHSYQANAFWVESQEGLVLIDTLMLKSEARQLVATLKATGKPVKAVLITHPHVDHFGGIRTVLDAFGPGVNVYATRATTEAITSVHRNALSTWAKALGDDFEQTVVLPNIIVESGNTVSLAGLHYRFIDLGQGESESNSVIHLLENRALFTGDATVANAIFYVGEGHAAGALLSLQQLQTQFREDNLRVYSGHYAPAWLTSVVASNIEQVQWVSRHVEETLRQHNVTLTQPLDPAVKQALVSTVAEYYQRNNFADYDLPYSVLAQMNVEGLIQQHLEPLAKP